MILNLSDEQTRPLLNLLIDTIEADRYPNSLPSGGCGRSSKSAVSLADYQRNSRHGFAAMRRHLSPSGRHPKNVTLHGGHARDDGPDRGTSHEND
jgi:hypothetical protein